MNYEDEVIEAAKKGYAESYTKWTPETEKLLRLVYQTGYKQAKIDAMLLDRNRIDADQQEN